MQKILKSILSFCLAIAVCLGTAAVFGAAQYTTVADAATADTYYSGITAEGGTQLLGQLHDLITTTHTYYTSYSDCKADNAKKTDPGSKSNTVMEFYTHIDIDASKWDVSGGWNREHVWAKSDSNGLWETSGAGSDLHHIRPAEKDLNNHRGNMKYGEVGTGGKEEYTSVSNVLGGYSSGSSTSGTFEPLDNVKGDVARILMYVYTHYNTCSNSVFGGNAKTNGNGNSAYFGTINFTHIVKASNEDAAKQLLLKWNKLDPVDEIEITRNEAVYAIEHNRNPFIDNSSYADAIWGSGTVDPNPGPGPQPSDTLKNLYLNASSVTMYTGQTYDLTVTPNPVNASASVTWSSSDTSVATVTNGKISAKAAGTATITATSTVNSSIKATATVTVKKSSSQGTASGGTVTITIDSFTNPSGYAFYEWEEGDMRGTAYIYKGDGGVMQFNTSKSSFYIASTSSAYGPITSVTVKAKSGTTSQWKLLTSTDAYSQLSSGNPTDGNEQGSKTVTPEGTTWTVDGSDTYFALVREGTGAAYIYSIEITYGTGNGGNEDPPPVVVGGNVQLFRDSVADINADGTLAEWRSSINTAISVYKTLTNEEKVEAAADIGTLSSAIESYNAKIKGYNGADETALKGARVFL